MCPQRENPLRCWGKINLSEPSLSALLFYMLTHFPHFFKKKTILFSKKCRVFLEIILCDGNTLEKMFMVIIWDQAKGKRWNNNQLFDKGIISQLFHLLVWDIDLKKALQRLGDGLWPLGGTAGSGIAVEQVTQELQLRGQRWFPLISAQARAAPAPLGVSKMLLQVGEVRTSTVLWSC